MVPISSGEVIERPPLGTKNEVLTFVCAKRTSDHNHMVIHFAGEPQVFTIEGGNVHRAMNTTNNGDEKTWQ